MSTTAPKMTESEIVAFAHQFDSDLKDPTIRAGADLAAAIHQLDRSERGHRIAVSFRRFLEAHDGASYSLDSDNWRAVETLARSCRIFGAWAVREDLPKR